MLGNLKSLSSSAKQCLKVPHHCSSDKAGKITYSIAITTGSMKFAGTDANISIRITGAGGDRTSRAKLDNAFRDDFERGCTDKFRVKLEDIGEPTLVALEIDHSGLFSDWYACLIVLQKSGSKEIYTFPVYSWVEGTVVVPNGEAKLPQNEENPMLISFRKNELSSKRRLYKWRGRDDAAAKGLPGYISAISHDALPKNIQFPDGLYRDFEESKGIAFVHGFQDKLHAISTEIIDKWDSLEEFTHFMSHPKIPNMPDYQKDWLNDCEFGRQMLNGCNPCMISQCKEIPKNFPVTDDMVKKLLKRPLTEELKAGKLFLIDCKVAKDIEIPICSCVPLCLLYDADSKLKPIAIQLQQEPDSKNPIWTPNDSEYDWMLAKMHFRSAESNIHQIVYRILYTHLVLEPFAVAMLRCLSSRHPLHKLLHPHLQYVCAANTVIRTSLLSPGGVFDKLLAYGGGNQFPVLRAAFRTYNVNIMNTVKLMKKQGTDSLKAYYYKDDGIPLFKSIGKFVEKIIMLFYSCDDDVKNDRELQHFIKEVHDEGFAWEEGKHRGCPTHFGTRAEVVDVLSGVIFTATCQHAATNSGQLDTYMYVPNSPLQMSKPPLTAKGKATLQTVVSSLPDKRASITQVDIAHSFSKYSEEEVYLGNFPSRLFCDEESQKIISIFQKELQEISKKIKERNSQLKIPYEYLMPEKIPNGLTV